MRPSRVSWQEILYIPMLKKVIHEGETLQGYLSTTSSKEDLLQKYRKYIKTCNGLLDKLADVKLPAVKPRWADFTDAGPGVGCSNFEVRFRDAEFAIIHNSDYHIRLHPSRENSADNEAE